LRSDGHFTRDFLYIEDAVDVQLLLAESLAGDESIRGEAFNFSHGVELEVIEIVNSILRILDSNLKPDIQNNVKAETKKMLLSSKKAKQLLGWQAKWDFESALEQTINWYVDYFSRNKQRSF
jgi:CDP-glucose 4,6-dehydratase